ncbi:MAG: multicopper polyphenol oxidase [Candidatus Rokuibacteriota bacterium]|nr:MAG: multicopper polyphenol oxidase [Candidatus Rokubacteria bacterium]PYO15472.1 MAG: multicopper polyphenol oxidase [Candidatus Rokubacteria bacterium]
MTSTSSLLLAHGEPAEYFTFSSLNALGVPHATTTRHCPGISSFEERIVPEAPKPPFRAEAVVALGGTGLEMERVSYARQVHGADVARAPAGGGFAGLVDILVTAERGVPLAIFTADCLAIVLYDPSARALGVAHVGWRGTVRGATQKAVRALGEVGGRAGSLRVAIAPSIGPCCYEVDEPVTAEFARAFGERWRSWVTPSRGGRVMLDLWSANEALLAEAGVAPASIENPRLCTACHPDLLYSYRRGNRGRLATLAALP